MAKRMMYIRDDGVGVEFSGEREGIGVIKADSGGEKKGDRGKEICTLRKLVSRYRSHLVYDKCHCTAELQGLCVRCTMIEAIDSDLSTMAKERDDGQ